MASNPSYPELSEAERFPLLTTRGRELLYRMRQHPFAPIWNWPNGEQLNAKGLERVQQFAHSLQQFQHNSLQSKPTWLTDFVERCHVEVPFYRKRNLRGISFEELPSTCRADLAPRVWDFVPDSEPIDEIILFSSSGTTGYPTRTAHHPYSAACGIPLLEFALKSLHGIALRKGPDQAAITNVAAYRGAYTTAIVVAYLNEAGCIRVNLDESAWRKTEHRAQFINVWNAPIWLGDPVAYGAIDKIPLDHKPQAIVSSIMHITDAYVHQLEQRYACPVLDLYAMTEAGIIAVRTKEGHRILPHDLFVEILDPEGGRCPDGVRGEVTLTGGRNPFLPLLRYRTGDFASLTWIDGHRVLVELEGRHPVEYPTRMGRVVHSMEVTRLMRRFPVIRYELKSVEHREYELHYQGDIDRQSLSDALADLFGHHVTLREQVHSGKPSRNQ